jgi:hypothetical protein
MVCETQTMAIGGHNHGDRLGIDFFSLKKNTQYSMFELKFCCRGLCLTNHN